MPFSLITASHPVIALAQETRRKPAIVRRQDHRIELRAWRTGLASSATWLRTSTLPRALADRRSLDFFEPPGVLQNLIPFDRIYAVSRRSRKSPQARLDRSFVGQNMGIWPARGQSQPD
jgi:hypothetical protein